MIEYISLNMRPDYSSHIPYNIGDLPLYGSRVTLSDTGRKKIPPHWNSELELLLVKKGSVRVVANGKQYILQEDDIFIIDAGCLHYIENGSSPESSFYIGLMDKEILSANRNLIERFINPIFHCFSPGITHIPAGSEYHGKFRKVFREMYVIIQEKTIAYELLITAKCYEILTFLIELQQGSYLKSSVVDSKTFDTLKAILDYIHINFHSKISIQDLCKAGGISRNTCFQLFKDYLGDTPSNFIVQYRLNQAATLLTDSSLSISEIAHLCGFSQQSHFTQHFSKTFEVTPLQYRKMS